MTTTVSARIGKDVKAQAEQVMAQLGLTHSQVISVLYSQIALQKGLPFEIRVPDSRDTFDIAKIKGRIAPLAEKYDFKAVSVFGSVARGEAGPGSDIDLLVEPGANASLLDLGGFEEEARTALGAPVDIATARGVSERFAKRVKKERIVLYER